MNANFNLRLYPLPASIVATLNRVDAMADRFHRQGISCPDVICLSREDFVAVDTIVRRLSRELADGHVVTWNGRHLAPLPV